MEAVLVSSFHVSGRTGCLDSYCCTEMIMQQNWIVVMIVALDLSSLLLDVCYVHNGPRLYLCISHESLAFAKLPPLALLACISPIHFDPSIQVHSDYQKKSLSSRVDFPLTLALYSLPMSKSPAPVLFPDPCCLGELMSKFAFDTANRSNRDCRTFS